MSFVRNLIVLAAGVLLAATVVPGIGYDGRWEVLALVALVLALLNAVLKPLLIIFTLPFIIITLGLGIWVVNAVLLMLAARLVDSFHVSGFGAAMLGSLIISLTHMLLQGDGGCCCCGGGKKRRKQDDDVIDV